MTARVGCENRDPDLWFPTPAQTMTARMAKAICFRDCLVREACLAAAFRFEGLTRSAGAREGIWGGLDEEERTKLGRRLARLAKKEETPPAEPEGSSSALVSASGRS